MPAEENRRGHGREEKVLSGIQAAGGGGAVEWGYNARTAQSAGLDISSGLILHWKKRYEEGGLVEGPTRTEKELLSRISQLEQMVGRLTMENDLLKKAVQYTARLPQELCCRVAVLRFGQKCPKIDLSWHFYPICVFKLTPKGIQQAESKPPDFPEDTVFRLSHFRGWHWACMVRS